jgi:hypothetical protein
MMRLTYFFLISLFLLLTSGCDKEIKIVEDPIKKEPDKLLSSCGTLDYWHSMFIVNNKCFGENLPQSVDYRANGSFAAKHRNTFNNYDCSLNLYFNGEKYFLFFIFNEGPDAILSDYQLNFQPDTTKGIKFQFNKDSTEFSGTIKNIILRGGHNKHLPGIPDSIHISDGSFRMPVKK